MVSIFKRNLLTSLIKPFKGILFLIIVMSFLGLCRYKNEKKQSEEEYFYSWEVKIKNNQQKEVYDDEK
jgi:hypothetical protein